MRESRRSRAHEPSRRRPGRSNAALTRPTFRGVSLELLYRPVGTVAAYENAAHLAAPVRYMGTKRGLAPEVRRSVQGMQINGRVLDLFSGMGSVAAALAGVAPVATNDALSFTAAFARARFLDRSRRPMREFVRDLARLFWQHRNLLASHNCKQLRAETSALGSDSAALTAYMRDAPFVGNDEGCAKAAHLASKSQGEARYCMASLYFGGGYLSLTQAIEVDSIRFAIDRLDSDVDRDWLLSAWLAAIGAVINAPGHTAQFLKPNTEQTFKRVRRCWLRSVWRVFLDRASDLVQVGDGEWRSKNLVFVSDALTLLKNGVPDDLGLIYADPPYTRDQYSRYYHVYESLYRYDFPECSGMGRYPTGRFSTDFSVRGRVRTAFESMLEQFQALRVPYIISYPRDGLLEQTGTSLRTLLQAYGATVDVHEHVGDLSTLGAAGGEPKKRTVEVLYVCNT